MNTFQTIFFCFSGRRRTGKERLPKNPLHNLVNLILAGASAAFAA